MKKYIRLALALMFAVSVAFVSVASAAEHKTEKKAAEHKEECKEGMGMDAHGKCVGCKDGKDAHGAKCEEMMKKMEKHMEEKKAH